MTPESTIATIDAILVLCGASIAATLVAAGLALDDIRRHLRKIRRRNS